MITDRLWWAGERKAWPSWFAAGSSRPLILTERRLVQWPHLTVTVLNRLLQGTLTCRNGVKPMKKNQQKIFKKSQEEEEERNIRQARCRKRCSGRSRAAPREEEARGGPEKRPLKKTTWWLMTTDRWLNLAIDRVLFTLSSSVASAFLLFCCPSCWFDGPNNKPAVE